MAIDFWGGVAAPEELVPFPDGASIEPYDRRRVDQRREGAVAVGPRAITERLLSITRGGGRRAVVGLAILFLGVVIVRALGVQFSRALPRARTDRVAQVAHPGLAIDIRDEPRRLGLRRLAGAGKSHIAVRRPRALRHSPASGRASHAASPATRTAVAYSPPETPTAPATSSTASSSSSGSTSTGADSGGGSGSGGQSHTPGPTGPGANFGPGQLGGK